MKMLGLPSIALVLALGAPLAAQTPHFGFGVALSMPTGGFNSTGYPPSGSVTSPSNESYNATLGGQFTVSFPVDPKLAFRLDIYGQGTDGKDTAAGYATYNLRHELLSFGGEAQYFPGTGSAYRHVGGYVLGGLSMDMERFSSSYGDPYWYGYSTSKTRLGGLVGWGYSFPPYRRWRSNIEIAFHKTLSYSNNTDIQPTPASPATPPADFLRVGYGLVF